MSYAVLVVDDNDMNLMLISKILELENYQEAIEGFLPGPFHRKL